MKPHRPNKSSHLLPRIEREAGWQKGPDSRDALPAVCRAIRV